MQMTIDTTNLRDRIASQRRARKSPSDQTSAPGKSTSALDGDRQKRTARSAAEDMSSNNKRGGLQATYRVPVLGYVVRIITGVLNLPRIISNLYVFFGQTNAAIAQLSSELANARGTTERARQMDGKLGALAARLSALESAREEGALPRRPNENEEEALTKRLDSIQAVVLRALDNKPTKGSVYSTGKTLGALNGLRPVSATLGREMNRPRGAARTGEEVIGRIEAVVADAGQAIAGAPKPVKSGPGIEAQIVARLHHVEQMILDLFAEQAKRPTPNVLKPMPIEHVADPAGELPFRLAAAGAAKIAVMGMSERFSGASLFDIEAWSNPRVLDLINGSQLAKEHSELVQAVRQFTGMLDTDFDALIFGPMLEVFSKGERSAVLRWLRQFSPGRAVILFQVGRSYWTEGVEIEASRPTLDSKTIGTMIAMLAAELGAVGFHVRDCVVGDRSPEGARRGAGGFVLVSMSNG